MDRFYLQNAALYEKLVDAHDASAPAAHFSRHKAASPEGEATPDEEPNPAMVIGARIRPMLQEDLAAGFPCAAYPRSKQSDNGPDIVDLHDLYNHPRGRPILKSTTHKIDKLYPSTSSTEQIYTDLVSPLISFAQEGGIATLFAYGQTGSGKTFTISHLSKLAATALLSSDDSPEILITIADLAGSSAFDLLSNRKPISVLEDAAGETQLAGATEHRVSDQEDVLELIDRAAAFRATASTFKNDASSRSHSITRLRLPASGGVLYLVDLAGSEMARDVASHGADRMRETKEINISLSVLKDCVRGKAEQMSGKKGKVHVPIRRSTLTKVLKHVFDPEEKRQCRTVVIACVNPSLADVGASKNTLRYAEMLRVPVAA